MVAPRAARSTRTARGGVAPLRVLADGRLVRAGEPPPLGPIVARHTLALAAARGAPDPRGRELQALIAFADELDRALPTGPVRLEILRATGALEAERAASEARGELPAALSARLDALQGRLAEALSAPPTGPSRSYARGELAAPVEPAVVTSFFGLRDDPFDGRPRYHLGLDLEAETGQTILASAAGVVVRAGAAGGHGLRVELEHAGGLVTGYSHLSELFVTPGMSVARGQVLGLAGETGRATGPHLHFEVWAGGEPEDPLARLPDGLAIEVRGSGSLGE